MTFLARLQAHRGGLIRLNTELFWYGGRGWDRNSGRACLIMDATVQHCVFAALTPAARGVAAPAVNALLLIEDRRQWIRVAEADVEVVSETR